MNKTAITLIKGSIFYYIISLLFLFFFSNVLIANNKEVPINQWILVKSEEKINLQTFTKIKAKHKYVLSDYELILYLETNEILTFDETITSIPLPLNYKYTSDIEEVLSLNNSQTVFIQIKTADKPKSYLNGLALRFKMKNLSSDWLSHGLIKGEVSSSQLNRILEHPDVLWVERAAKDETLDEEILGITNASLLMPRPNYVGLNGTNMVVGVGDNSDIQHIDFKDRVISYNPTFEQNHGEHVSGTIAGKGNKDWYGRGYAPNATIISDYFSQIIVKSVDYSEQLNMSVTNNSYGQFLGDCNFMGRYNATSQITDEIAINAPSVLHVFAAANDGYKTCFPYPASYQTVNGGFASSKNNIVVANMRKQKVSVNQNSSRGPTKDGRVKPEITAIGTLVYAPVSNNGYSASTGTSMAAPNVAGASVLLQEFYKNEFNALPSSTLLKNALLNGATHLLTEGPNYQYGYGLLNAFQSKEILGNQQFQEGVIQANNQITYTVNVPSGTTHFKVLLNWLDPAAHPNAPKALVHDLDLQITGPNQSSYLPWILNPLSDHVTDAPVRGVDTLNNVEQISILNPNPGDYQITVSAADLIENEQEFVVSYHIQDSYLQLQYPTDDLSLSIDREMNIYWDHSHDLNNVTNVYYSSPSNPQWLPIASNLPATQKHYIWQVPNALANEKVKIKVNHDNFEDQTNEGVVFTKRTVLNTPDLNNQCWGSINFTWNPLSNIDSYSVYLLIGDEMQVVDTVTLTHQYKFTGLNPYQEYWYTVAPIVNGETGIRSIAQSLLPQGTNCNTSGINGDLTILKGQELPYGRKYTSLLLSNNDSIPFIAKNISPNIVNSFKIHFRINNGSWQEQIYQETLQPNEEKNLHINGLNLENTGTYVFDLKIENLDTNDPITSNNETSFQIKHLDNPEMDLNSDWIETFESWIPFTTITKDYGMATQNHWDFTPHDFYGRVYVDSLSLWSIEGQRNLSIDNYKNISDSLTLLSNNKLRGTFNFSDIDIIGEEIRFQTDYILHHESTYTNKIQIRGSDTDPWLDVYTFPNPEDSVSIVKNTSLLNLNEVLINNNQNFSSSFQLQIIQQDSTKISTIDYGTGLTLDNLKFIRVHNDLEMLSLEAGPNVTCSTEDIPLKINIKNNVPNTVYNIPVMLFKDDQIVASEVIDSIQGNTEIIYDFDYILSPVVNELYKLQAVVSHPADTYSFNDTSKFQEIKIQGTIANYPYFENFDLNNGGYYATGKNNSWNHGEINAIDIKNPFEGNKAWKTNLTGYALSNENSYLYSPCFDISNLDNPYLSFMASYSFMDLQLDEEDSILDYAAIQYSHDGINWLAVPADHQYHLHYIDQQFWHKEDLDWKSHTIKVSKAEENVQFRWKIKITSGAPKEGLTIDNIHLYDYQYPIGVFEALNQEIDIVAQQSLLGLQDSQLSFVIDADNNADLKVNSFYNSEANTSDQLQQFYPQMWTLKPVNNIDQYSIGLAILDSLLDKSFEACYSCLPQNSIYDYAVYIYSGNEPEINKYLDDNVLEEKWHKNPLSKYTMKPYGKGYIVSVKEEKKGELWLLNNNLIDRTTPLDKNITWEVHHYEGHGAYISWSIDPVLEEKISSVQVHRLKYDMEYHNMKQVNIDAGPYEFVDFPDIINNAAHYKLKITTRDNHAFYTEVKTLKWDENLYHWSLFPNPNKGPDLNLFYATNSLSPLQYQIIHIDGKIIDQKTIEITKQTGHLKIQSNFLSNGKYFLKIIQDKNEKVMPFIKL